MKSICFLLSTLSSPLLRFTVFIYLFPPPPLKFDALSVYSRNIMFLHTQGSIKPQAIVTVLRLRVEFYMSIYIRISDSSLPEASTSGTNSVQVCYQKQFKINAFSSQVNTLPPMQCYQAPGSSGRLRQSHTQVPDKNAGSLKRFR